MIVDSHTHIFSPEIVAQREAFRERDAWFGRLYASPKARMATAEDLVAAMDEAGVDVAVTFGFGWSDPGLCRMANDYTAEAVRAYPGRLIGLACVNPAVAGAPAEVMRAASVGLRGIGELMPDGQGFSLADVDTLAPLMEAARELGWPVLSHATEPVGHSYAGKGSPSLAAAVKLAGRFPGATLILAHWGGGLLFYELMPEVRAALANVYYDTAASRYLYDDGIFPVAAGLVGDRVLFGSDYPLLDPGRFLSRVRAAGLPEQALDAMLGGNAARLFGLGGAVRP
jgi:predicted TIM-barrel fold metal-dependent hydrolase